MLNFSFLALLVRRYRGGPKLKCGAADLSRRPLADKFLCRAIVPASAYQGTKFNFLAWLVLEIWRGPKIKIWSCWSPKTPPSGQILTWSYTTCKCLPVLVRVNAYKCAKFQLPSTLFKNLFARGCLRKSGAPTFILGPPHIFGTNQARKLKFGMLVGICRYYGYM